MVVLKEAQGPRLVVPFDRAKRKCELIDVARKLQRVYRVDGSFLCNSNTPERSSCASRTVESGEGTAGTDSPPSSRNHHTCPNARARFRAQALASSRS